MDHKPKNRDDLAEFVSSDGQSVVPDPIGKDSSRPADKSVGEKGIPDFATKVEALNAVVGVMAGMPKEKIGDIFKGLTDGLSDDKARATRRIGGTAQDNTDAETLQSTMRSPTSAPISAEEVKQIFGDDITEEFTERAATIFEAAVNSRLSLEVARLEEAFEDHLVEALQEKVEQLSSHIDQYLTYAVNEWVSENKLAIDNGLRASISEDFMAGLHNLFMESHIDIPEDKADVVAEMAEAIADLENKLNETHRQRIAVEEELDQMRANQIFHEAVAKLPLTQQEKLRGLVEGITYSNSEEFSRKLGIIVETYFAGEAPKSSKSSIASLTEAVNHDEPAEGPEVTVTGPMSQYVAALARTSKAK